MQQSHEGTPFLNCLLQMKLVFLQSAMYRYMFDGKRQQKVKISDISDQWYPL